MKNSIHPAPTEFTAAQLTLDPILRYFHYMHLPAQLQLASGPFCALAEHIVEHMPRNAERTVALRKLLEAKDAAVRSNVENMPAPITETWQMRLVAEHKELVKRADGLGEFATTFDFANLPDADKADLLAQHMHMSEYRERLETRMKRHGLSTHPGANIHGMGPDEALPIDGEIKTTGGDKSEEPLPFE